MAKAITYPYGAYELKRSYQKNMFMGTLATVALVVVIIFVGWLYKIITYDEIGEPTNVIHIKTIADLGAPPSLSAKPPQIDISKPKVAAPKVGIPTPVADDEVVDEDIVIASQDELQEINAPVFSSDGGDGSELVIDVNPEDYMPAPEDFIPHEEEPQLISQVEPEYPRLAREGGFTANVLLQAYVDANGDVKKVQIVRCTRPGMGFEEAASKAFYDWKWRPAIQNGNPIGVWISYTVEFVMNN